MTLQLIQLQGPSQCVSSVHITSLPAFIFLLRELPAEEETLRPPQETWGFSEVGACPLAQHRRLPRPFLAGLDGSGSGCLGRGGLARGIHDPILSETSLIRPTSPHALLFPVVHQGKSLGEGVPRSSPQGSHRTGSSDSRLLQSPIRGPKGFDWLILDESRTTCIQARDRLLHLCEELGLQVNHRKSSLVPSQDMTYLGMQILSVRFIAKPTETRVVNLLNIIEEFLSSPSPPAALW